MKPDFPRLAAYILTVLTCGAGAATAFDDGARAYFLLPDGSRVLTTAGFFLDSNQGFSFGTSQAGAEIDITVAMAQYTQTFSVGGQQAAFFVAVPYGDIDGTVNTPLGSRSGSANGFADPLVGAVFGITGAPALAAKDYVRYDPGFGMAVLFKYFGAFGDYDSSKILNIGSNRSVTQLAFPMNYIFSDSLVAPDLTMLEINPSITMFGDNDDPGGGAIVVEQDPIYRLEAHLSHNISKAVWISADALYSYGGETITDGLADGNTKRSLALGATVNFTLPNSASIKITYGKIVSSNNDGSDGSGIRLTSSWVF